MLLLLAAACVPGKVTVGDPFGDTGLDTSPPPGTDLDGDGYAGVGSGGYDCDDADPTVHPEAVETWYDGTDQDCSGGSDYDQDSDGVELSSDCDDTRADIAPGEPETRDLADQDCDGLVDEDFVSAGMIVVSEVMQHPLAVSDTEGEWFELTNTDTNSIDVQGWTIYADDGDSLTIAGSVVIGAGRSVVLDVDADPTQNGGVTVDYTYDRATMSLSSEDSLFLGMGDVTIFDVEWSASWDLEDGASIQLDSDHTVIADARQSSYWCAARSELASGDRATPGATNDDCTSIDEDGDGYSPDRGDCDDDDPTISPGADEQWNGVDDDCDGVLDNAPVDEIADGSVDGPQNAYLGIYSGLGVGNLTGDGGTDLVFASCMASNYAGKAWLVDGDTTLSGDVEDVAEATYAGEASTWAGATPPLFGDVTGDGRADWVVAGTGTSSSSPAFVVFEGASLSGDLTDDDATAVLRAQTSGVYGNGRVETALDLDGDGVDELIYSIPSASGSSNAWYAGKVYFYEGGLDGDLSLDDAARVVSGSSQYWLGLGLGGGDVDGDGYDDAFVGSPRETGAWYQIDGDAHWDGNQSIGDAASRTYNASDTGDGVGFGTVAVADLDGDDATDVAFGGFRADTVWIYLAAGGLGDSVETNDADITIDGDGAPTFGFSVSDGDFDGDGITDLAVGAPAQTGTYVYYHWAQTAGSDTGEVSLFDVGTLSDNASSNDAWAVASGETDGDLFGAVMSRGADVDGDGADDLLVSALRGAANGGRAWLLRGSP